MTKWISASILFLFTSLSFASLPDYKRPELLARANGKENYNLPSRSYLYGTSPVLNNRGDVVFKVTALEGQNTQGLWLNSKMIYTAEEGKVVADANLNSYGDVVFTVYEEGSSDGLFLYNSTTSSIDHVIDGKKQAFTSYTYSQILDDGHVVFRGTDKNDDRAFYDFSARINPILFEGTDSYEVKASYLFRPVVNNQKMWAFKARLGDKKQWQNDRPDQIILLKPTSPQGISYTSQIIAKDKKGDKNSRYASFENMLDLSEKGHVVFLANLENNKKILVVNYQGVETVIAQEGKGEISELELFSPKVNSQGVVAFRAKDLNGRRGIFVSDGQQVRKLIGEGDEIKSDLGRARIYYNAGYAGFGGDIDLNDKNEIVFYCVLVSDRDGSDWGAGVYKLAPQN